MFVELFKTYNYLPITTDSHLGEYLQWAYSVADHEGILDFYENYKIRCLQFSKSEKFYKKFFDLSNKETHERVVPIIEAIIEDSNILELAVNVPNNGFIDSLPRDIVVEVPASINKKGVKGVRLDNYPKSFGSLLNAQTGTIQMTTEAVLNKSKHYVLLAMLADPVVDDALAAEKLLNTVIEFQNDFLGYLN